jgi:acetyltransferase-like isoleucine patch superfamily enzyme
MSLARLGQSLAFRLELLAVLTLCRLGGVRWAIRYLRNPAPRATPYVLRHFGAKIGPATTFKRTLYLDNVYEDQDSSADFSHLEIGRNCYIGDGVYFDLANRVIIEDNVVVSGRVSFLTHSDCNRSAILASLFERRCEPVKVQADVWIGFGATILGGVNIGSHVVVAAGAVVTQNLEGGAVYGGVPAKLVRRLESAGGKPGSGG